MFGWFKKKPVKKILDTGRFYATRNSPFFETLTIAYIDEVKSGWVKYYFWSKDYGIMKSNFGHACEINYFNDVFQYDVTDKVKEYEANK